MKYTLIRVTPQDAAEIKRLFPTLKNDAYRVAELVRIVSVTTLPHPVDAQAVPVLMIAKEE